MRKRVPDLPAYMPGGPENPLGARALYLHDNGRDTLFRIHGSNEPWTIGHAVSSGCFRMRNEDITQLFPQVPVSTEVLIINQPFKLGEGGGELLLEVHTPLDEHGLPSALDRQGAIQDLLQERAELVSNYRLDWTAIRDAVYAEEGVPRVIGTALN